MALTKELIEQFQASYNKCFGITIDYNKAEQELKELAMLVRITSAKEANNEKSI